MKEMGCTHQGRTPTPAIHPRMLDRRTDLPSPPSVMKAEHLGLKEELLSVNTMRHNKGEIRHLIDELPIFCTFWQKKRVQN